MNKSNSTNRSKKKDLNQSISTDFISSVNQTKLNNDSINTSKSNETFANSRNRNKDKVATFLTDQILSMSLKRNNSSKSVYSKNSCESLNNNNNSNTNNKRSNKNNKQQTQQQQPKSKQSNNKQPINNKKISSENKNSSKKNNNTTKSSNDTSKTSLPNSISSESTNNDSILENDNKKTDIRARYWSYLFDNLKRSINEIYLTCENDNSIRECKEVILILENCTNDFRSLITRIKLMNDFEVANRNNKRPNSVAWELSKSSPPLMNSNLKNTTKINNNEKLQPQNRKKLCDDLKIDDANQISGFKEFKPTFSNISNHKDYYSYDLDEEDDSDYIDDLDDDKRDLSDPIDQLNHETFSDMQSINTEDVSLNTLSPSCDIKLESYFANDKNYFFNTTAPSSSQSNNTLIQQDQYDSSILINKFQTNTGPINGSTSTFSQSNIPASLLNNSYPFFYHNSLPLSNKFDQMQRSNSLLFSANSSELSPFNNFNNNFNNLDNYDLNQINLFLNEGIASNSINSMNSNTFYSNDTFNKLSTLNNITNENNQKLDNFNNKNMLKFYEEEEENIALEIKQDKQLLSILAQEEKLTKQLSVEKLFHYNHQYEILKKIEDDFGDELAASKVSTDFDTNDTERNTPLTVYWNKYTNEAEWANDHEELETTRTPGRAQQMHEKLSFMNRKVSPNERRKKHEEKQARAQEKREKFYQDRLNKLKELTKKIQEVNELKKKLLKAKKMTIKAKMQRAEEKRLYLLNLKATKAAVEEQKVHEIAFINSLAAQNRKHDILEKYEKRHEAIKQNLEEERLRKQEEQKAKEQAAELRRKELETQRITKLKEMLEKRKIKQFKIEQTQMEKEKERIEMARAKEKTREMRLAVIEAQYQANRQQTKKRIMQKQEEWSKRHESNLEEIRKKAFEMTILRFSSEDHNGEAPTPFPYEKAKFCNVCNVIINSEVKLKSHLNGSKHQQIMNETSQGKNLTKSEIEEYNLNCIIDMPKEKNECELFLSEERQKWMKKRVKKLKAKIFSKGVEYETNKKKLDNESNPQSNVKSSKLIKLIKELEKTDRLNNLDRNLSELNRMICQKNTNEQNLFKTCDGFSVGIRLLEHISQSISDSNNTLSYKSMINVISLLNNAVKNKYESSNDILLSNKLYSLIEILNLHSSVMTSDISDFIVNSKNTQKFPMEWLVCSSLIQLVGSIFTSLYQDNQNANTTNENMNILIQRAYDIISLITSFGIIDSLSVFFNNVITPLDDDHQISDVLHNCLDFLISITKFLSQKKTNDIFSNKKTDDSTQFISTLKITNLVNIISMLYGMLHKDASTPVKYNQSPPNTVNDKKQPFVTLELTNLSFKLLNQMIILDLNMIQNLLGEESLSLQLRHICSYLIWYLNVNKYDELLHEIIIFIGYFSVLNTDNQIKIELGTPPTILQQLCNLPFNYFSDKNLISVLYPTLICCCYDNEKNKQVLANELNTEMMANFIQEKIDSEGVDNINKQNDKLEFSKRFPSKLWNNALEYYSNK